MIARGQKKPSNPSGLESNQEIRDRIVHGFDRGYFDEMYRDVVYAYTNKLVNNVTVVDNNSKIPVYPAVRPRGRKPGKSNRILQTSLIAMSRAMSRDIDPQFPQVDQATAEVRKQAFLIRDKGQFDDEGNWRGERGSAFVEGDAFGVGWVLFGYKLTDDGKYATDCQHIPCTQMIWDRHARHPKKARWICAVHYLDPVDAAYHFGKPLDEMEAHAIEMGDGPRDVLGFKVVRVFEYMSIGIGGKDATHAIWLHELEGAPVYKKKMPFPRLPVACMVGFLPPGVNRPTGRVQQQLSGQMMLNKIEEFMNRVLDHGWGVDVVDETVLNAADLQKHARGDLLAYIRANSRLDGREVFKRVPSREVNPMLFKVLEYAEQRYVEDSGVADWDRGALSRTARSATEVATLDARSSMNQAYTNRQTAEFFRDFVRAALMVMEEGDNAPMDIDVFGHNVRLNDPGKPDSCVKNFLEEPSQIVIGSETLTADDDKLKKQADLQNYMELAQLGFVGVTVDEYWYTRTVLKLMGVTDDAAIKKPAQQQPATPGMPQDPSQQNTAVTAQAQQSAQQQTGGMAQPSNGAPPMGAPRPPTDRQAGRAPVRQAALDQKQLAGVR